MPIKIPYSKGMESFISPNEAGKYEYPNAEEYIKLPPAEQKKVYDKVYAERFAMFTAVSDIRSGSDWTAMAKPKRAWYRIERLLDGLLSAYNQVISQEKRAKKAKKEGVSTTSGPAKWDTFMKYGAVDKAAVIGSTAMAWTGQGLAGYDFLADKYNDYVDYKLNKASELATPRCIYDEDGNGTEKAIKCGKDGDCPEGQVCRLGSCSPGCEVPGTYDFLRQMADPKENISFKELADFVDQLGSPVPPLSSCVIPHINNFFNVIPWQYYLMKSLEAIADELLSTIDSDIFDEEALNKLIKEQTVCGTEAGLDLEAIKNAAHLKTSSDLLNRLDFLPLPNIPYIPWPPPGVPGVIRLLMDPLNAVRVLVLDLVCWTICGILNPIVYYVLAVMLREEQRMIENQNDTLGGTEAMLPSALDFTMKKSDVNDFVTDDILEEAHQRGYVTLKSPNKTEGLTAIEADHQHVLEVDKSGNGTAKSICHPMSAHVCHEHEVVNWTIRTNQSSCYPSCKQRFGVCGAPPHIHQIPENLRHALTRKYIETVNYDEGITVKDLITLLAGSATCRVKGILIKIGKQGDYPSLGLVESAKILQFWQFLGNNIDMFAFIEKSKIECEPQVCPDPLSEELLRQLFESMNKACELMRQPETLAPLSQKDIEMMAIGIGNNILSQHPKTGDAQLDKDNNANIIPSKTRDRKALSEKCQKITRKSWLSGADMDIDEADGKPCFAYYEGDDDEIEADMSSLDWKHCAGERKGAPGKCKPAPTPAEKKGAAATAAQSKCPTGTNWLPAQSTIFTGTPGGLACVYAHSYDGNDLWVGAAPSTYDSDLAEHMSYNELPSDAQASIDEFWVDAVGMASSQAESFLGTAPGQPSANPDYHADHLFDNNKLTDAAKDWLTRQMPHPGIEGFKTSNKHHDTMPNLPPYNTSWHRTIIEEGSKSESVLGAACGYIHRNGLLKGGGEFQAGRIISLVGFDHPKCIGGADGIYDNRVRHPKPVLKKSKYQD